MPVENRTTIVTGGTPQILLTQASSRSYFALQNNSAGLITVGFEVDPNADGPLVIPVGGFWYSPPGFPIAGPAKVWGPTTGQKFTFWAY